MVVLHARLRVQAFHSRGCREKWQLIRLLSSGWHGSITHGAWTAQMHFMVVPFVCWEELRNIDGINTTSGIENIDFICFGREGLIPLRTRLYSVFIILLRLVELQNWQIGCGQSREMSSTWVLQLRFHCLDAMQSINAPVGCLKGMRKELGQWFFIKCGRF